MNIEHTISAGDPFLLRSTILLPDFTSGFLSLSSIIDGSEWPSRSSARKIDTFRLKCQRTIPGPRTFQRSLRVVHIRSHSEQKYRSLSQRNWFEAVWPWKTRGQLRGGIYAILIVRICTMHKLGMQDCNSIFCF